MTAKIEKMAFVSIVFKGTYEPSAQLSLNWGKSGVGFTMINEKTNGPVNAHLLSCPSKAQNIQNLKNIW